MSSSHLCSHEESYTFLQLMSQYRLTEGQCNQQVSDIHLEELSHSGSKQWKSLPPHLNLEAIAAEDIDKSLKGEREKRYEFLLKKWKEIGGSTATYRQLITALLKSKCRQDAEKLCEMLKESVPQSQLAIATASATHTDTTHQLKNPTKIEDLDEDTQRDLRRQLKRNLDGLILRYASFGVSLYEAVKATGVTLEAFRHFLLSLSLYADDYGDERPRLLDHLKDQIYEADSIIRIFQLLTTDCCSFIDVDIYQFIIQEYNVDTSSDEDLQYSKYLKSYLMKHKISEFKMIRPRLHMVFSESEELIVKFNTDVTSSMTMVLEHKSAIAGILGLKSPAAMHLISVKEGCVLATFSIQSMVAEKVFARGLSAKQEADFRASSVLWLKCGDYELEEIHHKAHHRDTEPLVS